MFYKLKSFKILAETKSFTETAKRLAISQPAVSQHIKFLQEEFKDELFQKINNNLVLTPKGQKIYESIGTTIDHFEETLEGIKTNKKRAKIKMVGPFNFLNYKFIPYIGQMFGEDHHFEISYGNSQKANELLLSGEIDIAVVSKPLGESHIDSHIIFEEDLILATNKKYASKLSSDSPLRIVDMSGDLWLFKEWMNQNEGKLKKFKMKPELSASITSVEGIYNFILHHPAASVIPLHMAKKDLGKKIVSLYPEADNFTNRLYLCRLKRKRDPETREVFERLSLYEEA